MPILLACAVACGKPPQSGRTAADSRNRPIDLAYTLDGEPHSLSELQGRPVFLVLMRTSDMPCQIYMAEVKKAFLGAAGKTRFVVLTIEPTEAPFTRMYEESEALPFPIGVADPVVAKGQSELGEIPLLPTTYLIDSRGKAVAGTPGIIRAEELIAAIKKLDLQ